MGGHIVRAFAGVDVGKIFGGDFVEGAFQVDADVRVGVFVDGQGSGCVLNEDVQQAHFEIRQFRYCPQYVICDQVKAAGKLRQCDASLMPSHVTSSEKGPRKRDGSIGAAGRLSASYQASVAGACRSHSTGGSRRATLMWMSPRISRTRSEGIPTLTAQSMMS